MTQVYWDVRRSHSDFMADAASLCGLSSEAELMDNALALMKWAGGETRKGRKIVSVAPSGDIETISIPCLEVAQ